MVNYAVLLKIRAKQEERGRPEIKKNIFNKEIEITKESLPFKKRYLKSSDGEQIKRKINFLEVNCFICCASLD